MKRLVIPTSLAAIVFLLVSCKPGQQAAHETDALVSHIDSTVRPGDDFFLYANGQWFKEHPIPASEATNGLWQMIQDTINAQVRDACESASALANPETGSAKQKIGDFFRTGMDSVSLNRRGLDDLKAETDAIDGIKDLQGIARAASTIHIISGSPLFRFYVTQDDKISSKNAIFIWQGGLSLPDRNYYFETDERTAAIRAKFQEHLHNMFVILGYDDARATRAAADVMKLETALAKASRKREDTRDPLKNYTKISFRALSASTPNFDWAAYMEAAGLKGVDTVIIGQPEFLTALNRSLKDVPLPVWKDYLKYHLLRGLARFMDDKTFMEYFNFYSGTLRGVKEPKPRWKRVVEQTDGSLGELIGQVYVAEYLPKGTKEKLLEIGNAIKEVFAERIRALDWMSDATKAKALQKLSTIIMKVGYPDKWKDLSSMEIDRSSYVHNGMNANRWHSNYMMAKFGKPVDRSEWDMEPQTYNAYYNPSNNEIVVPGCNIIISGYERVLADDALLYAVVGGTFGHEITHGFDDQGCKYDDKGNLNNWWTREDSAKFYAATRKVVRQFSEYVPVDTFHINGELTLGENIADIGGVMIAYEAFKRTPQYRNREIIAGLNPDQRFFLGYALAWMVNERPEAVAMQVRSNEHSPAKFRVIGPLEDMPEFYATFGIRQGDSMWRPESLRVQIW